MVIFFLENNALYVEICTTKYVINLMLAIYVVTFDHPHLWLWKGNYFLYIWCIDKIVGIKMKMQNN